MARRADAASCTSTACCSWRGVRARQPWSAVDALWRDPPASSEQVLHREKYDACEAPIAVPDVGASRAARLRPPEGERRAGRAGGARLAGDRAAAGDRRARRRRLGRRSRRPLRRARPRPPSAPTVAPPVVAQTAAGLADDLGRRRRGRRLRARRRRGRRRRRTSCAGAKRSRCSSARPSWRRPRSRRRSTAGRRRSRPRRDEVLAHDAQLRQVVHVVIEQRHLGDLRRRARASRAARARAAPTPPARRTRARPGPAAPPRRRCVAAGSAAAAGSARSAAAIAPASSRPGAAWTRFATKPVSPMPAARSRSWKNSASSIAATSGTSTSRKPDVRDRAAACRRPAARARKPVSTS